jgi:hypothetical protein
VFESVDWTLQRNVLKVKDAAEAIVAKTSTTSNTVNYLALIILVARICNLGNSAAPPRKGKLTKFVAMSIQIHL